MLDRRDHRKSTTYQRLHCRTQMQKAELPTHQVTVMHRDLFRKCAIDWRDGQNMDALLESLDMKRISLLIQMVRAYAGFDEEDDG